MYNSLLFLFEKGYIMQPPYVAICLMNQAFTKDTFDQILNWYICNKNTIEDDWMHGFGCQKICKGYLPIFFPLQLWLIELYNMHLYII